MRYALINPQGQIDRFSTTVDPANCTTRTGWKWLPADPAAQPAFDPKTQVISGPTYSIGADAVTESYNVRNKTAQELDADKDGEIAGATSGGRYNAPGMIALQLENEIRDLRAKINTIAPGTYPAGQASQITMTQFRNGVKALLS